jgi:hypothetical protein
MNAVYTRHECPSQQIALQVTRSSDIKNTWTPPCLHLPAKPNEAHFHHNTAVARMNAKTLVLLQWPWLKAVSAPGGDSHGGCCRVTWSIDAKVPQGCLLTHGQPCGWTTSIPAIHKQVAWQDTRNSEVKCRPKFLRRIFSHYTKLHVFIWILLSLV